MEKAQENIIGKQAVALSYDEETSDAPKVIAKGKGFVAENIIQAAKQNAIPIYQNKTLAAMLMAVDLDREIPPDLYKAIAEVLAYVYRMDQNANQRQFNMKKEFK